MRSLRTALDRVVQADPGTADIASSSQSAARALAFLFAIGGTIGWLVVALPHPDEFDVVGFAAVAVLAYAGAGAIALLERRLTWGMLKAAVAAGTVLITCDIVFSGESRGAPAPDNEMLYVWVALYSAYFFNLRWALAQVAWVATAYGVALAFVSAASVMTTRWIETVGTLLIAVLLIALLQRRVRELLSRLADAARTDPLTELHNRRGFEESIAVEIERARRGGHRVSLLLGDLDHFKRVNDRLGHAAGDSALALVGRVLREGRRQIDYAARTGGEEFALILPDTDEGEAYVVAERLRSSVERAFDAALVPVTFSFGIAEWPRHGQSTDSLLGSADRALYAAKELGRNRTVIFSPEIESVTARTGGGEEVHLATLLALAEALDMRDAGTADHSQTVGRHCELAARQLGLAPARVGRVRLAGVLHDVGKIGLSDSILRKPGPLTDEEWAEMRRHPEIGARILGASEFDDIRPWVLAHHERPDGKGYPQGLRGDEIPLEARVLAVADAYEAMTSDRAYRAAIGPEAAKAELRRGAGSQFDPRVVQAFLAAIDQASLELAGDRGA